MIGPCCSSWRVDAVAEDNTVNIAEKAAGFAVTGHTGTEAGVSVTVTLGAHTFAAATSAKATPDASTATWSVPVPAGAGYVTGAALALTVAAAKTGPGYTSPPNATRSLTVDLTAPTKPSYTVAGGYTLTVGVAAATLSPSSGTGIDTYACGGSCPRA